MQDNQDLYDTWMRLLSAQDQLLDDLGVSLRDEKDALLTNQLEKLRDSTLKKDKAVRKLEQLQGSLRQFSAASATRLGFHQSALPLRVLFEKFEDQSRQSLQARRQEILIKSRTVSRLNEFNQNCLKIYTDEVRGIMQVLNLASRQVQTYNPCGKTEESMGQGRLLSRSL